MSEQIEIEIKSLLTEDEYLKILSYFNKNIEESYIQINYYIDTLNKDILNNKDGLRIRKKSNYELTFKTPKEEGLLEINQIINENEFLNFKNNNIFPEGEIKSYIKNKYNIDELKILASLTTYRIDINYKKGILSLDKNIYNNVIDYELEYETNSMEYAKEEITNLFNKININFKQNKRSKLVRAMDQLTI